ncbi:MAG: saccharopine dehydrogenase NADP-binding domain-containing protein, partial [Deltaproteobacteria bacterium]|nr:saccharopine dehydrogenase NADP-binding domain-containing protein [Deltaproteobacteria bacterium]
MKIIVLGGAGDMGSRTVEDLAATADVELVTIADGNLAAADRLASRLQGQAAAVDTILIDADNHRGLVQAMRGYDVVASALGPFHRFENKLVHAAIEAEVDYTSICDEWEAVEAVMGEASRAAEDTGRIVITGMGASPGLTNVGVRFLDDQMDHLRRVEISCYQPLDAGGGEAVLKHMMYIMSGEVASWRRGEQVMVPACSETRVVDFPQFGPIQLWNMGHSEPFTVPRTFPDIEEVSFFMGFGKGANLFVKPARWGWFQSHRWVDRFAGALATIEGLTPDAPPGLGALRVDAWGQQGDDEIHRMVCGTGGMREVTGLSLSVGALMLGRRELLVERGGVYAPEACIRPRPFIQAMIEKGVTVYEDLAM